MEKQTPLIPAVYEGWHAYQMLLIEALAPLTEDQLLLRAAPHLRTVGEIATHIITTRAGWFYFDLNEQDETFGEMIYWADEDQPQRSAAELVAGLEATWAIMQAISGRWTADQWAEVWNNPDDEYGPPTLSRPWVIWHLVEHDLHHGGEVSLTLGAHGLRAPQL